MKPLRLQFPDDYFKEEIRDDFVVTEKTKKIWAVELDLFCELMRVCKKYDIKVFAFAGTMLGAVRHRGFIPWDDDMDVCLDRQNYEKLLSVADKEFKQPYFFQTALSDRRFFCKYARLRNSNTTGIIAWNNSSEYNNGIYLDIFVLDGYIDNKFKLRMQLIRRDFITKIINAYHSDNNQTGVKRFISHLLKHTLFKFTSYEALYQRYIHVMTLYEKKTNRRTLLTHNDYFITRYWCTTDDLKESIQLPFEFISIPVSSRYDTMLRNTYGNYMQFPPVEKRGTWHNEQLYFDPDIPYKEYFAHF